jgi:hypothetical protein
MSEVTERLHYTFINAFGNSVVNHGDLAKKPLDIDLAFPNPPRIRLYMYTLVAGGRSRRNEYKAVLRVPRHPIDEYRAFDHEEGRFTILVAYDPSIDVFVLWDVSLHHRFKNGGNIQIKESTVLAAAATGCAEQTRRLSVGRTELVLACRSDHLPSIVERRLLTTGEQIA